MKIKALSLHVALNFGGFVAGTLNIDNIEKSFKFTEQENGILVERPTCRKLVPWSNIQSIDYYLEDGSEPVVTGNKGNSI